MPARSLFVPPALGILVILAALATPARADPGVVAAPAPAPAVPTEAPALVEPAVQLTVIEDGGSRVEELRVRGEVRRITVVPKNGSKAYEIIPANGARDLAPGPGSTKGAAGQRVWNVLQF